MHVPCSASPGGTGHSVAMAGSSWPHRWYNGRACLGAVNLPSIGGDVGESAGSLVSVD